MASKSNVYKESVKKVGYWNYKDFYNFCFGWLKDNGYKVKEDDYTEKNSDIGKEIILSWDASKKVTDYFKYTISLKWHILGMVPIEIERAGKVEKTNKGEVKIDITADVVKDYDNKWEAKPYVKIMRGFYDKYIMNTTSDLYSDRLVDDVKELINQIKSFLEL